MSSKINASTSGVGGLVSSADNSGILELQSAGITKFTVSQEGAYGTLRLETAKNATGTAVDFTGIPSWVKRITVMFAGVSTSGTSFGIVQLGDAEGVENTGYSSVRWGIAGTSPFSNNITNGLAAFGGTAADLASGQLFINLVSSTIWVASGSVYSAATTGISHAGSKTLSTTLDRIRITTVNGTDTFDSGIINLLLEG